MVNKTNEITLNCIIVPFGPHHGHQLSEVTAAVTVDRNPTSNSGHPTIYTKINIMGTVADSNEAVRFVGEESEGRVDYTIKCIKELIAITEGKQYQIIGFAQNVIQCESAYQTNKRKRKADDAFGGLRLSVLNHHHSHGLLEVLITELEAKKTDEKARLEALRQSFAELDARILKLEQDQAERENRKFQTRCIQIAKEILNEEPMIEYCSPF
ncbi:unnamed protein product [Rhizophagus irregularis]|nr:unnamed protein product [Rhizophagus irregularis]